MKKSKLPLFALIFLLIASFITVLIVQKLSLIKITRKSKAQINNFIGSNVHSLPLLSDDEIKIILNAISACVNSSVVRFWGFSGGDNIEKVLRNAPANMQFIITLSNYYQSGVFQPWPAPEENPTAWFGGDWKTNGFASFVQNVTQKYKNNPKILIWEIMNEPNCSPDVNCVSAQHEFLKEVSDMIAQNDPGKLISPGLQAQNTGGEHFDNGDYEAVTQLPNISANSCHLYLENPVSKTNCLQALDITKKNNKVFYLGELGYNLGCTSADCTNTCGQDKLNQRKDAILATANEFSSLGAAGSAIWQYSPERNATLTCDGASVFPGDPLCQVAPTYAATPTLKPTIPAQPTPTIAPTSAQKKLIFLKPYVQDIVLLPKTGSETFKITQEALPQLTQFITFLKKNDCPFPYIFQAFDSNALDIACFAFVKKETPETITYQLKNEFVPYSVFIKSEAQKNFGVLFDKKRDDLYYVEFINK